MVCYTLTAMLKTIARTFTFLLITIVAILFYLNRAQTHDFSQLLGDEITVCNATFDKQSKTYQQFAAWLKQNQKGWKHSPATYLPQVLYAASNMTIGVNPSFVVINFVENTNRQQVILNVDTTEIFKPCAELR